MGRICQRYYDIFRSFRNYDECLLSFSGTVDPDAVVLEILLCLSDEFLAGNIEYDSVDRLKIKTLVVNVYDLSKRISCRMCKLIFIRKMYA